MVKVWVTARSIINYGYRIRNRPLVLLRTFAYSFCWGAGTCPGRIPRPRWRCCCRCSSGSSEWGGSCRSSEQICPVKGEITEAAIVDISDLTFLLRKSMIAEVSNHLLLQMELNNFIDSCILLTEWSSSRVRSYSDIAEQGNNFWPSNQSLCNDTELYIKAKWSTIPGVLCTV